MESKRRKWTTLPLFARDDDFAAIVPEYGAMLYSYRDAHIFQHTYDAALGQKALEVAIIRTSHGEFHSPDAQTMRVTGKRGCGVDYHNSAGYAKGLIDDAEPNIMWQFMQKKENCSVFKAPVRNIGKFGRIAMKKCHVIGGV